MTDERREDQELGVALARAIDTQRVRQTPFEQARIVRGAQGFPIWRFAFAGVAAIVLALAFGTWLLAPRDGTPVAVEPTSTPVASGSPTTAPSPSPDPERDSLWVYFTRDQLPPVGATVRGISAPDAAGRIAARLNETRNATAAEVPAGLSNPLALTRSGQSPTFGVAVQIQGDLATVEFDLSGGWNVRGAAQSQALLQQLVYTISEEAGIRRVLIKEKGKANAVIDQTVVDKPLRREDVFGYSSNGSAERLPLVEPADRVSDLSTSFSVEDFAPGLARFVINVTPRTAPPRDWMPAYSAEMRQGRNGAKWDLEIKVHGGVDARTGRTTVDRTPLRTVNVDSPGGLAAQGATTYTLGLDDARPWRTTVLRDPLRIVVDIGGHPQSVSGNTAVYSPRPGESVARTFSVSGLARAFEATVQWRVRSSSGQIVASGFTTASIGTSAVWGGYRFDVTLPATVSGNVTLEVYQVSPRDGSDTNLVAIPLAVR